MTVLTEFLGGPNDGDIRTVEMLKDDDERELFYVATEACVHRYRVIVVPDNGGDSEIEAFAFYDGIEGVANVD